MDDTSIFEVHRRGASFVGFKHVFTVGDEVKHSFVLAKTIGPSLVIFPHELLDQVVDEWELEMRCLDDVSRSMHQQLDTSIGSGNPELVARLASSALKLESIGQDKIKAYALASWTDSALHTTVCLLQELSNDALRRRAQDLMSHIEIIARRLVIFREYWQPDGDISSVLNE